MCSSDLVRRAWIGGSSMLAFDALLQDADFVPQLGDHQIVRLAKLAITGGYCGYGVMDGGANDRQIRGTGDGRQPLKFPIE